MVPLWIAIVFLALFTIFTLQNVSEKEIQQAELAADVMANDFVQYRTSVLKYQDANPAATGNISSTLLSACTACLPLGYTITAGRWENYIDPVSKSPIIFSLGTLPPGVLQVLNESSGESLMIGKFNSSTGQMISYNGSVTINVPTTIPAIPDKALVMMGR